MKRPVLQPRIGILLFVCFGLFTGCGDDSGASSGDKGGANGSTREETAGGGFPRCNDDVTVSPPEGECYQGDSYACEVEAKILELTNGFREGKSPFAYSRQLTFAARNWSEGQAGAGKISHDGFPDARYDAIRGAFEGLEVTIIAENVGTIGATFKLDAAKAAEMLTTGWWESEGHKKNMLSPHSHMGVGIFYDGKGGIYATQLFGCE